MNNKIHSLECRNIKKYFGGVKALDGVSLSLKEGEIRALFGGNGSGKSTLAKILGGVISIDSGEIFVNDKNVSIKSPKTSEDLGLIITSQELSLFYNITVEYNIMMHLIKMRNSKFLDHNQIREGAYNILKRLDHVDIAEKDILGLPDNKKYIIEFAKSLVRKPKLLIIDEITSALYAQEFEVVKDVIFELKDNGVPVIFISHRMNEIYDICESVTVMRNGVNVLTDEIKNIDKQDLLDLMTGRQKNKNSENEEAYNKINKNENAKTKLVQGFKEIIFRADNIHIPIYNTNINIEAKKGSFIGISGLQGQGQSDLIRTLFGLRDKLIVEIDGNDERIEKPIDAIKKGIGFISGNRETEGVFAERPIYENIDVINNYILNNRKANYEEILKKFQIKIGDLNDPIKSLSGGNQQKVVISRWLSMQPKVLLADDPSKGVDVQARKDIHKIIKELVESGSTVLMVSSDDAELADIAKLIVDARVLIMYAGQVVKELIGKEITIPNIIHYSLAKGIN